MNNTHQKKHIKSTYSREIVLLSPDNNESYAQVMGFKGDARFDVKILSTNKLVIAKAKGALIKGPRKQRILKDDYVLIQENSESDNKYYILYKYSQDDVKKLKKLNEIVLHAENSDDEDLQPTNKTSIVFETDLNVDDNNINYDDEFIANI